MIDFSLISNNRDRLIFWLEKLKLIFKSLLLMGENARSKPFPLSRHQEKTLISNLLYILRYLYLINDKKKKNKTINELFIKVIKDLDLFIIFMIDHMNERYSGFSSIPKDFKTSLTSSSNPTIPPYNFLLYEIFNNILVGVNGSKIISIPEIKILKAEDLSDLHNVVLSDNWIYAFTDNQLIISVVSEGFNESLYLKLFNAHQIANENRDSRNKCLILMEERNKRLKVRIENEVYELILWILETNEEKKNCDWYNLEKRRRKAKHEWKKIWRHLRINENIWQPDDLKAQNDNYFLSKDYSFDNLRPNKYFYFEMWKYEIKNKSRPYLKMKLKEPIPQIKIQIFEKTGLSDNILNYQQIFNLIHQNFYVKSQYLTDSLNKIEKSPQKIAGNILNLGEKALNTIKSIVANKQKNSPLLKPNTQNAELLFQRKCQWISILQLKTGIFTLTPIKMM